MIQMSDHIILISLATSFGRNRLMRRIFCRRHHGPKGIPVAFGH